eukprot:1270141-Amphidinium_carterae.1
MPARALADRRGFCGSRCGPLRPCCSRCSTCCWLWGRMTPWCFCGRCGISPTLAWAGRGVAACAGWETCLLVVSGLASGRDVAACAGWETCLLVESGLASPWLGAPTGLVRVGVAACAGACAVPPGGYDGG